MSVIDPNIICRICGNWHCETVNDPVCFPILRNRLKKELEEMAEMSTELPSDEPEDLLKIDGYIYLRMWRVDDKNTQ